MTKLEQKLISIGYTKDVERNKHKRTHIYYSKKFNDNYEKIIIIDVIKQEIITSYVIFIIGSVEPKKIAINELKQDLEVLENDNT